VVKVDKFAVFPMLYLRNLRSTLLYIMTTIHSGFLLTPMSNKDDLERPIHLKVRFPDDTVTWRTYVVAFRADNAWL